MLVSFGVFAFCLGLGDPAGNDAWISAGVECCPVAGQFGVALGDCGSVERRRGGGGRAGVGLVEECGDGAAVRTTRQPLLAFAVFDQGVAIVLDGTATTDRRAVVVRDRDVVNFISAIFEQVWEVASPYAASEAGYDGVTEEVQIAIANMLADGMTDEVVARRLGISVRACRRHIAVLFGRLNSVSRFQVGARAASAGLLATDSSA